MALYTQLLGLPEFEVPDVIEDRKLKQRRLVVVPSRMVGICPVCHKACDQRHAHHDECEVTDLPMASFATTLVVRVWQFHWRVACPKRVPLLSGEGTPVSMPNGRSPRLAPAPNRR